MRGPMLMAAAIFLIAGCNLFDRLEAERTDFAPRFADALTKDAVQDRDIRVDGVAVETDSVGQVVLRDMPLGKRTICFEEASGRTDSLYRRQCFALNVTRRAAPPRLELERDHRTWHYPLQLRITPSKSIPGTQRLALVDPLWRGFRINYYWYLDSQLVASTLAPEADFFLADTARAWQCQVLLLSDFLEARNHDTLGVAAGVLAPTLRPPRNRPPVIAFGQFQNPSCRPKELTFQIVDPDGNLASLDSLSLPGRPPGGWSWQLDTLPRPDSAGNRDSLTGSVTLQNLSYATDSTVRLHLRYSERYDSLGHTILVSHARDTSFTASHFPVPRMWVEGLRSDPYYWGDTIRAVLRTNADSLRFGPGSSQRFFWLHQVYDTLQGRARTDTVTLAYRQISPGRDTILNVLPDFGADKLVQDSLGRPVGLSRLYMRFRAITPCGDTVEVVDKIRYLNPSIVLTNPIEVPLVNTPCNLADTLAFTITNNPRRTFNTLWIDWGDTIIGSTSIDSVNLSPDSSFERAHNFFVPAIRTYSTTLPGSEVRILYGKAAVICRRRLPGGDYTALSVPFPYQYPDQKPVCP